MFERRWLDLPLWSPVSRFAPEAAQVSEKLSRVDDCVYLFTNDGYGTEGDPGVGSIFWARSPELALSYLDVRPPAARSADVGDCVPPGAEVTGFEPLTFGEIVSQAEERGLSAQVSARYAGTSGEFLFSSIRVELTQFLFSDPNPDDDDEPVAIRFDLRK